MTVRPKSVFRDDPRRIAEFLVREHGVEGARRMALEGTTTANDEGDLYRLSIWREVKALLRDRTTTAETEPRGHADLYRKYSLILRMGSLFRPKDSLFR